MAVVDLSVDDRVYIGSRLLSGFQLYSTAACYAVWACARVASVRLYPGIHMRNALFGPVCVFGFCVHVMYQVLCCSCVVCPPAILRKGGGVEWAGWWCARRSSWAE